MIQWHEYYQFLLKETKYLNIKHNVEIKDKRYIIHHDEKITLGEVKNQNLWELNIKSSMINDNDEINKSSLN